MSDRTLDAGLAAPARLGDALIGALNDDFQKHGAAAIASLREEKPEQYLKLIASLAPKEAIDEDEDMEALSDEEIIERLRALHETVETLIYPDEVRKSDGRVDGPRAL